MSRRRSSLKSVMLVGICFTFVYIFIDLQVVLDLGDILEKKSLQNAQPISELSDDFNNIHSPNRRNKVFRRRRTKDKIENRISSEYTDNKKDIHGAFNNDVTAKNDDKHDAVIWRKTDTYVKEIPENDAVLWNNDKQDAVKRKNDENNDVWWNNDKHNGFIRNNDKHDTIMWTNDKYDTVKRKNDRNNAVRIGDIIGNLPYNRKTNASVVGKKILKPIKRKSELAFGSHMGSINHPLQFVPNESFFNHLMVPYISPNVTKRYLWLHKQIYTQKIAIISPIRNSEWSLDMFKNQLVKLSYPRNLISVYFGESGSTDKTFEKAAKISNILKAFYKFKDAAVISLKLSGGIQGPQRHDRAYQKYRRGHLAMARNRLVQSVLKKGKFDQILSIDSDLEEFPPDLVQQMLFAKSDVVVTPCLMKIDDRKFIYDCNSWKETKLSLKRQKRLAPDTLVLECYGSSYRIYLSYLKHKGRVVKVDGVGGCGLMVKADCFRSGLQFPEVVYKHHIETEGLAKMALDMGFNVVGLPFVEVFHHTGAANKTNN